MIISLIAAVAENRIIGANGDLPWSLPADMKFFSQITKGHHVLMGRKNFESIPAKYRPLPGRTNLVITRNADYFAKGIEVFTTIGDAIQFAKNAEETELFVIGGGEIYRQTIEMADRLYLTEIDAWPKGDTQFPAFNPSDWERNMLLEQAQDDVHNFAFKTYCYRRKD